MAENYKVDNVDLKILEILMQDAKKPYTEVAKKAFVSGGTVHVRMNKLEEAGIVEKTTLKGQLCQAWIRYHCFYRDIPSKECLV